MLRVAYIPSVRRFPTQPRLQPNLAIFLYRSISATSHCHELKYPINYPNYSPVLRDIIYIEYKILCSYINKASVPDL